MKLASNLLLVEVQIEKREDVFMKANFLISTLMLLTLLSACTGRSKQGIQVDEKRPVGETEEPAAVINEPVKIGAFDEKELRAAAQSQAALTYKFHYLTYDKSGDLTFVNGSVTLAFTALPANQTGDMTLEIFEGATLKLKGTASAVSLKVGQANNINIKLDPVVPGDSGNGVGGATTTDVNINVTINNGAVPGVSPQPQPTVSPAVGGGGLPPVGQPGVVDPLAGWDGKSNRGNDKWDIVAVP
jgi:hypothetical protein